MLTLKLTASPTSTAPSPKSPKGLGLGTVTRSRPQPTGFSTKPPVAPAPSTGCQVGLARQASFHVPNSKARLSGDARWGLTGPGVRLSAPPLLRDPGAESEAENGEGPPSQLHYDHTQGHTRSTGSGAWTQAEQEPHLDRGGYAPNGLEVGQRTDKRGRENLARGKTLKHKQDSRRARIAPGTTSAQDNLRE